MWWLKLFSVFSKSIPKESDMSQTPTEDWELYRPADQREINVLSYLHPEFAKLVKTLLYRARNVGLAVYIFEGHRSWERQEALYRQGRDGAENIIDRSKVVTMAKPGQSFHNYGLAVDIVFDGDTQKPNIQWSWSPNLSWKILGKIGQDIGLEWAGTWIRFVEYPHFQIKVPGVDINKLKEWYKSGGIENVWKNIN